MYRHESQLYAVIAIGAGVLIWKVIDEVAKFFSKDERAAAREHELKMAELKLKQPAQEANPEPLNPVSQDAMDELKKLREARAKVEAMAQPKVDTTTDRVRPFPTRASSIADAQAFERNPGAFVFKSVA
jgi:hypothetical protein